MPWQEFDAGDLRHKIEIHQQVAGTDESGAVVTYEKWIETFASIKTTRASDFIKAGQDTAQLYLTITIRWQSGIDSSMRVKSRNGTYTIQAIENIDEMNTWLVLTCIAVGKNQ